MRRTNFKLTILLYLCLLWVTGEACDPGWFGRDCEYKCFCKYNKCNIDGNCIDGSMCEEGSFGPACQYVDAVYSSEAPNWLSDINDETCNPDQTSSTLSFIIDTEVTWLRIIVRNPKLLTQITIMFNEKICRDNQAFKLNDRTREIHCDIRPLLTKNMTLSGAGVRSLCSLYVSAGRSMAFRQIVSQTSNWQDDSRYGPQFAVDGLKGQYVLSGSNCASTKKGDTRPQFTLTFRNYPRYVTRIYVFNRLDTDKSDNFQWKVGMRKLGMRFYNDQDVEVFSFQDKKDPVPDINVFSFRFYIPVKKVWIVAAVKIPEIKKKLLSLCELVILGDTVCPKGRYGMDCEHSCSCVDAECFSATGGCPNGCPAGRQYEDCVEMCGHGFYGVDCSNQCPGKCMNSLCHYESGICKDCVDGLYGTNCDDNCPRKCPQKKCDRISGKCLLECQPGMHGPYCDQACSFGFYGTGCSKPCPPNCLGMCNVTNGDCQTGCVQGYIGQRCETECKLGYYGFNCSKFCEVKCGNFNCDKLDGSCQSSCLPGFMGNRCDEACSTGLYGVNCSQNCLQVCPHKLCNFITGECRNCPPGFIGFDCMSSCQTGLYGANCSQNCSHVCSSNICNSITGQCLKKTCPPGFTDPDCTTSCQAGYYGTNCSQNCLDACPHGFCQAVTGECLNMTCPPGFTGSNCTTNTTIKPKKDTRGRDREKSISNSDSSLR